MNILALDLATKTGWALYENGVMESGVMDFTKRRGESNGMLFLKFNRWLYDAAARPLTEPNTWTNNVDLIVFEQAHHRGGAATEIAVGLMTRVLEFCAKYTIEHASVHTATLKKFATGKGNASKEEMIEAANKSFNSPFDPVSDDNEADALCLLNYAIEKFGGPSCSVPTVAAIAAK